MLNCTTQSGVLLLCVVQFNMNKTLYVISNSTRKIFWPCCGVAIAKWAKASFPRLIGPLKIHQQNSGTIINPPETPIIIAFLVLCEKEGQSQWQGQRWRVDQKIQATLDFKPFLFRSRGKYLGIYGSHCMFYRKKNVYLQFLFDIWIELFFIWIPPIKMAKNATSCNAISKFVMLEEMIPGHLSCSKGQLISEWIVYKVIVAPKIRTKNCQDICPYYTGQKSWQFFVQILGEIHKFILKFTDL